ncbi:MAG: NADH-quinone oxidoreductase subunit J family protein, partial [Candidatus Binataceae bacterium]
FVAMVQLLVYIGGILVLTIFAVMLTQGIADVNVSNRTVGLGAGLAVTIIAGAVMLTAIFSTHWYQHGIPANPSPTTSAIGNAFLGQYMLPFEVASLILLAALIGAIVISRQETKE